MRKRTNWICTAIAAIAVTLPGSASAEGTVKIALIEPLSGPAGGVGKRAQMMFNFMIDRVNAAGGVNGNRLELVSMDDEGNPEKTLINLKRALDENIHYIAESTNGTALVSDAIAKYQKRNPDKEPTLYMNYANPDMSMSTNKCSFWTFNFDANVDMRSQALTSYIANQTAAKKVYVFNQDFSVGRAFASDAVEMLTAKRKDIQIVGNELIPLNQVKDFSPYVTKMQAAGADSLYSSNYGNDLAFMIRAANDAGLKATFYTFYASSPALVTALGAGGKGVIQVSEWRSEATPALKEQADDFERKNKFPFYLWKVALTVEMLSKAMIEAKSVNALDVALKLEDMHYSSPLGEVWMRKDNHQIVEPLFIGRLTDKPVRPVDSGGYGFETLATIEGKDVEVPNACKMERPVGH
jgi:branched-chain amino acid transport system substrate-binding protein